MSSFPFVAIFGVADGEEVVLGGGEAVETELQIGAGVGKFDFGGADWFETGDVTAVNSS